MTNNRDRIKTIFNQINKIASKGITNVLEYNRYVEVLCTSGDYENLLQCLYFFYDVDVDNVTTIEDIRTKTWNRVLFKTDNIFTKKIKDLYDSKGIYQIAFDIFDNDNILLGQIKEKDVYPDEAEYYIKNREYARITGTRKRILIVIKNGIETTIDSIEFNSEDRNLINNYKIAIDLLLE